MKTLTLCALLLISCAPAQSVPACSVIVNDKKDVLANESHETKCDCTCPQARNIFELGGLIGGLTNLFNK